jgi:DNA-binding MarR family transcriptional regulator
MQVSARPTPVRRASQGLAAQLDAHWVELARFITSRRLRSSVYARGADLPAAQLQALQLLLEDGSRMSELAERIGVAESTVTRLVDRLEAAGLVERRISPPDRRCVVAELTPAGRKLAVELDESRRQFLAELLAMLPAGDRRELVRLFAKLTNAIKQRDPNGKGSA